MTPALGRATALLVLQLPGASTALIPGLDSAPVEGAATSATAEDGGRRWTDPEDGWFDLSSFIEHPAGFLPILVPITEPALGLGAVAAAAFLDPREEAGGEGWARPNITVVGGLRTEQGSEGVFAFDSRLWSGGERQTLLGVGDVGLELALYGIGRDRALDGGLDYRLDARGGLAEGRQRLGSSDLWLGLRLVYARAEVGLDGPASGVPDLVPGLGTLTLAGSALSLRYDSFDNLFTPTRGLLSDTSVSVFDDLFGSSQDFQLFQQVLIRHWSLREDLFLGARGQLDASFGEAPFYARPFIQLRGVPALRYQGEEAVSAELELRWQYHPRFGLVGFGGVGRAWNDLAEFRREQDAWGGGAGIRYLVSRKFGLHVGLDAARGPEDGAVYVQFGNAWLRP